MASVLTNDVLLRKSRTYIALVWEQILDGFGPSPSGEDPFDAVVGLFGMIDTLHRAVEPELA